MDSNILYYGERGIVNSIVFGIGNDQTKLAKLINSISLIGDDKLLNFLPNQITETVFVVEATFGDWGAPDLLIRVKHGNEFYFFVVEAKVGCFFKNSYDFKDNEIPYLTDKSSRINIQLALRYRFMLERKLKKEKGKIVFVAFPEKNKYDEKYQKNPRALKKEKAIKLLQDFFESDKNSENNTVNIDNVFYIALVSGQTSKNLSEAKKLLEKLPYGEKDNRFLNHCGIITYDDLEKTKIIDEKSYNQAKSTMEFDKCNSNCIKKHCL